MSEEIRWNVIQHSSSPILFYGLDVLHLKAEQVHKLSVIYNNAVRRCFNLASNRTVRDVLHFTGCLPVKMLLDKRRILLVRECLNCPGILGLCARISSNELDFVNSLIDYGVHYEMATDALNLAFCEKFYDDLCRDGYL